MLRKKIQRVCSQVLVVLLLAGSFSGVPISANELATKKNYLIFYDQKKVTNEAMLKSRTEVADNPLPETMMTNSLTQVTPLNEHLDRVYVNPIELETLLTDY